MTALREVRPAARGGYADAAQRRDKFGAERLNALEIRRAKDMADAWRSQ